MIGSGRRPDDLQYRKGKYSELDIGEITVRCYSKPSPLCYAKLLFHSLHRDKARIEIVHLVYSYSLTFTG